LHAVFAVTPSATGSSRNGADKGRRADAVAPRRLSGHHELTIKQTRRKPMPIAAQKIMPCLWFDTEAEAAAKHCVSNFKNSKIANISRYGKAQGRSPVAKDKSCK
jgi:hypothetical protein